MARISSNDASVEINGVALEGVQSINLDYALDSFEFSSLGSVYYQELISAVSEKKTSTFNVVYHAHLGGYDLLASDDKISIERFIPKVNKITFSCKEGGFELENCYVTSVNLSSEIGGFLKYNLTFECDEPKTITSEFTETQYTIADGPEFFYYKGSTVGGVFLGKCVQSFSLSVDIPRKIIKPFGLNAITSRQPETPILGSLNVEINKGGDFIDITPITKNLLIDQSFVFNALGYKGGSLNYTVNLLRYKSITESLELDGTATNSVVYDLFLAAPA